MATIYEEFYPVSIANVGVKFKKESLSTAFGCTGVLSGETEISEITAKCGRVTKKKMSKPTEMKVNISGFVKLDVLRRLFGMSDKGLKPGVYAYGEDSSGEEFTLTADIKDDFDDITKMIAFPKVSVSTGFKFKIDTSSDEVANVEIEATALPDENGKFYYETLLDEDSKKEFIEQWHKNFDSDVVKEQVTP